MLKLWEMMKALWNFTCVGGMQQKVESWKGGGGEESDVNANKQQKKIHIVAQYPSAVNK